MRLDLDVSDDEEKSMREFAAVHYGGSVSAWVQDLIIAQTNPQLFMEKMGMIYAKAEAKASAPALTESDNDDRAASEGRILDQGIWVTT